MTPDPGGLRARAQRWASRGRYGEAEAAYREALRLAPDDVPARLGLGLCLRRQRRPADAVAVLREALRRQRRPAEAEALHREAVQRAPSLPAAQLDLAAALFEQGKFPEAAAAYSEALRIRPDDAKAHLGLGLSLERQRLLDGALAAYG